MAFATEYVLTDKVSASLNAIDKALRPLPNDMKAVETELAKLNRAASLAAIDKTADPLKKRSMALKLQRDDLQGQQKAISAAAKLDADAAKKAKAAGDKAKADRAKQMGDDKAKGEEFMKALATGAGGVAAAVAAATAVVVGLGIAIGNAAVKAAELRKMTERKLGFAFGGADAGAEEAKQVQKIIEATGRERAEVIDGIVKLKSVGFDAQSSENILTIAEDARSVSDAASTAITDAYTHIKKSQNDMVNMGRGAFDTGDFDKLVESGAIDRSEFLTDLSKKYKVSQLQAQRMLQSNMVRGDVAENLVTKALQKKFNNGGKTVGVEASDRGGKSVDTQMKRIEERSKMLFASVDDQPIVNIMRKLGDFIDPESPRVVKFNKLISQGFTVAQGVFDKLTTGKNAERLNRILDFMSTNFDKLMVAVNHLSDAWDTKLSPSIDRITDALDPLVSKFAAFEAGAFWKTLSAAIDFFSAAIERSTKAITPYIDSLNKLLELGGKMEAMGVNIWDGLANGLHKGEKKPILAVDDMANRIPAVMRDELDIHSPSRVMARIGEHTAAGFAMGIQNYPTPVMPMPQIQMPSASAGSAQASGAGRGGGNTFIANINIGGTSTPALEAAADKARTIFINMFEESAYDVGAAA